MNSARLSCLSLRISDGAAPAARPSLHTGFSRPHTLGITRARTTQLLNLLLLAPDIQEQVLNLPVMEKGHEPVAEHNLRRVATEPDWAKQREEWAELTQGSR